MNVAVWVLLNPFAFLAGISAYFAVKEPLKAALTALLAGLFAGFMWHAAIMELRHEFIDPLPALLTMITVAIVACMWWAIFFFGHRLFPPM